MNKSIYEKTLSYFNTNKKIIALVLLLSLIVLSITPLVRLIYYDSVLPSGKSYYHLRIAEDFIYTKSVPEKDYFSFTTSDYMFNPYHLVLGIFGFLFGIINASFLIPFVLGILTALIFYLLCKRFTKKRKIRIIASIFFISSPIFISLYSASNDVGFLLFTLMLGFYLFTHNNKPFNLLSMLVLALIPFFGIGHMLIAFLALSTYVLYSKQKNSLLFILFFIYILESTYLFFSETFYFNLYPELILSSAIFQFLSDLGAKYGFCLFILLLALVGLRLSWSNKNKNMFFYLILLVTFILSFLFNPVYNIYLNMIFVIFASYAFYFLLNLKWNFKLIRTMALFFILLGILFTMTSMIARTARSYPSSGYIESMEWLHDHSDLNDRGIVLSDIDNGYLISAIGKHPVLIDENMKTNKRTIRTIKDIDIMLNSRHLAETLPLFSFYNIQYVFIDSEMKKDDWNNNIDGLLFLVENSEKFKRIYLNQDVEIWEYYPEGINVTQVEEK